MNATDNMPPRRLLTTAELAVCITVFRDARRRTQEQLAGIVGLNVRTVQRVEHGWPAGPGVGKESQLFATPKSVRIRL